MRISLISIVSVSIVLGACSSKDPAPPPSAQGQDSGVASASDSPPATSTSSPIPLTVSGSGRVVNKDGAVDCASDGATQSGKCAIGSPGDVLYASHGYNWTFDHWEPSMSTSESLFVPYRDGPKAITAVFRDLASPGSGSPADAGAD